jgi:hypothetical protein
MNNNKLAKAIALAMTGSALSIGAVTNASAHVMYNTYSTTGLPNVSTGIINPNGLNNNTDGWNYVLDSNADGIATGPESKGHLGTAVPWLGTTGGATPFGYTGSAALNWAAAIHGLGTLEVSSADALADYGVAAEIDTGAGSWKDAGTATTAPTGWKHQTDIGLIKSDISTWVRINLENIGGINDNFGVTVFTGMDTTTGDYSHHGGWNNAAVPETTSNPWYAAGVGSGMTYLTHDATVDAINFLEFFAEAGQVYTVALGGNGVGAWNKNAAEYAMSITAVASPVPVPAAIWLFGSAMAGLLGINKRSKLKAA